MTSRRLVRRPLLARAVVVGGLLVAMSALAVPSQAAPSAAVSPTREARSAQLSELFAQASAGGPSADVLRANGFTVVSSSAPAQTARASSGDDVSVTTPSVVYDTTYNRYTAVAKYHWDGTYWDDLDGNNGGPDGFALRFDRRMANNGVTGRFSGKPGLAYGTSVVGNPANNSSYGVGYSKQDTARALAGARYDYNMYSGVVTMDVGRPACGTTTKLYSQYFHTWSGSSVSGFSISTSGFGVSWTGNDHHWSASSQAGTWRITC